MPVGITMGCSVARLGFIRSSTSPRPIDSTDSAAWVGRLRAAAATSWSADAAGWPRVHAGGPAAWVPLGHRWHWGRSGWGDEATGCTRGKSAHPGESIPSTNLSSVCHSPFFWPLPKGGWSTINMVIQNSVRKFYQELYKCEIIKTFLIRYNTRALSHIE